MKPEPNPPRLSDSPEFSEVLKETAARRWNPGRLAENAEAIQAEVTGLTTAGAVATGTLAATVTKVVLPVALVISGGTAAVLWQSSSSEPSVTPAIVRAEIPAPPEVEEPAVASPAPTQRNTKPRVRPAAPEPGPPDSDLSDQLRLFEEAKTTATQGDPHQALRKLDVLEAEYPDTALRAEILLARAEYLSQSGDDDAAIEFVDAIQNQAVVSGKKAQLLRLVADIWLRRGVCVRAVPAYQRALGLGLGEADAEAARAGLKKCAAE